MNQENGDPFLYDILTLILKSEFDEKSILAQNELSDLTLSNLFQLSETELDEFKEVGTDLTKFINLLQKYNFHSFLIDSEVSNQFLPILADTSNQDPLHIATQKYVQLLVFLSFFQWIISFNQTARLNSYIFNLLLDQHISNSFLGQKCFFYGLLHILNAFNSDSTIILKEEIENDLTKFVYPLTNFYTIVNQSLIPSPLLISSIPSLINLYSSYCSNKYVNILSIFTNFFKEKKQQITNEQIIDLFTSIKLTINQDLDDQVVGMILKLLLSIYSKSHNPIIIIQLYEIIILMIPNDINSNENDFYEDDPLIISDLTKDIKQTGFTMSPNYREINETEIRINSQKYKNRNLENIFSNQLVLLIDFFTQLERINPTAFEELILTQFCQSNDELNTKMIYLLLSVIKILNNSDHNSSCERIHHNSTCNQIHQNLKIEPIQKNSTTEQIYKTNIINPIINEILSYLDTKSIILDPHYISLKNENILRLRQFYFQIRLEISTVQTMDQFITNIISSPLLLNDFLSYCISNVDELDSFLTRTQYYHFPYRILHYYLCASITEFKQVFTEIKELCFVLVKAMIPNIKLLLNERIRIMVMNSIFEGNLYSFSILDEFIQFHSTSLTSSTNYIQFDLLNSQLHSFLLAFLETDFTRCTNLLKTLLKFSLKTITTLKNSNCNDYHQLFEGTFNVLINFALPDLDLIELFIKNIELLKDKVDIDIFESFIHKSINPHFQFFLIDKLLDLGLNDNKIVSVKFLILVLDLITDNEFILNTYFVRFINLISKLTENDVNNCELCSTKGFTSKLLKLIENQIELESKQITKETCKVHQARSNHFVQINCPIDNVSTQTSLSSPHNHDQTDNEPKDNSQNDLIDEQNDIDQDLEQQSVTSNEENNTKKLPNTNSQTISQHKSKLFTHHNEINYSNHLIHSYSFTDISKGKKHLIRSNSLNYSLNSNKSYLSQNNYIEHIIDLFFTITDNFSSLTDVVEYISLFKQNQNHCLPFCIELLSKKLNDIILHYYYLKNSVYHAHSLLSYSDSISIEQLKSDSNFTFFFWFSFHSFSNHLMEILGFSNGNLNCTFYVHNHTLLFDYNSTRLVVLNNIDELDHWYFIALSFITTKSYSQIEITLNENYSQKSHKITPIPLETELFTIHLNGVGHKDFADIEISSYGLITNENIQNNLLTIYRKGPHSDLVRKITSESPQKLYKFVDVLINFWEIELVMPMIALCDIKFDDHTSWPNSIDYSLSIISHLLLSDSQAQIKFTESDSIAALSHLLQLFDRNQITFRLYQKIYELFVNIQYDTLRTELFTKILFNNQIWIVAQNDEHLKILKHWAIINIDEIMQYSSFQHLLQLKRVYYSSLPVEKTIGCDIHHSIGLKIQKACDILNSILVKISQQQFTKADFDYLVNEIIFSGNIQHTSDCLFLLNNIIIESQSNLVHLKLTHQDLFKLNHCIIHQHQQVICTLIDVISSFYRYNIVTYDFSIHLNVILCHIPLRTMQSNLYKSLKNQMEISQYPELFSILCCYALKTGDESAQDELIKSFLNIQDLFVLENNYVDLIWLILLAIRAKNPSNSFHIYSVLLNQFTDKWKDLFVLFNIISRSSRNEKTETYSLFINQLWNKLLDKLLNHQENALSEIIDFLKYSLIILFYKFDRSNLSQLYQLGLECYEKDEWQYESNLKYDILVISPQLFYTKLHKEISNIDLKYQFGLKIEEKEEEGTVVSYWQYFDLAKELLRKILNLNVYGIKDQFIDNIIDVLASYIHHFQPTFIEQLNVTHNKSTFDFFDQFSSLDVFDDYLTHFSLISKCLDLELIQILNALSNTQQSIDEQQRQYDEFYKKVSLNITKQINKDTNVWVRIWNNLSISNGPWDSQMVSIHRNKQYLKRDNAFCHAFCPMKMKKNLSFHKDFNQNQTILKQKSSLAFIQFEENDDGSDEERAEIDSHKKLIENCQFISVKSVKNGQFCLSEHQIQLIKYKKIIEIPLEDIKLILRKSRYHLLTAIELQTYDGKSFFIDFIKEKVLNRVINALNKNNIVLIKAFADHFNQLNLTSQWKSRKITTFEYLMYLNVYSGRSFHDLSQYPLFPWILSDYSTDIDFNCLHDDIFRAFDTPLGMLSPTKRQFLIDHFNESFLDELTKPYMFSSGPISPLSICLLLLRMEPFGSEHIKLQNGSIDLPERLFSSIPNFFQMLMSIGTESWELTPEFFYQIEFLVNDNELDLGKINDVPLNDVQLPKWAKTPLDFVYKHRKLLESEYVSNHIDEWINLIWGYQQRGEEAIKANNVYNENLYETAWETNEIICDDDRELIRTTLSMVGQIPPQLIKVKHPKRDSIDLKITTTFTSQKEICDNIFEFIGIQNESSLAFSSFYSQNKFVVISKNTSGNIVRHFISTFSFDKETFNQISHQCLFKFTLNDDNSMTNNQDMASFSFNEILFSKLSDNLLAVKFKTQGQIYTQIIEIETTKTRKIWNRNSLCISSNDILLNSDGIWLIYTEYNNSAVLNILKNTNGYVYKTKMKQYRGVIVSLAVSDTYKLTVIGTNDGALIIGSITSEMFIKIIDLKKIPLKLLITEGWGFIVVYSMSSEQSKEPYSIDVYTVNGQFVNSMKFKNPIDSWFTIKSRNGFDFLCLIQGSKVFYYEIYFLKCLFDFRCYNALIDLTYSESLGAFCAIYRNGKAQLQSINFDDLRVY